VDKATKLGIIVVNSPSGNIGAASEHTIALMMAVARNVPDGCSSVKEGKWERSRLVGVEVKGKTLGIIGLGKVGINVARCAIGLGMTVQAVDPYASPSIAHAAQVTMVHSLAELLPQVDFLTIHTPLIASTKGMIAKDELLKMKKGARILNVARGGMIDEDALVEALDEGHIAGAGIDVFTSEPPKPDTSAARMIAHPKVVATPHLGASTVEAQENVSIDVCEQVLSILQGNLPRSAVNAPIIMSEEFQMLQPFVRLVEKMGSLYTQHYSSHIDSEPRTSFDLVYEGSLATLSNTKPLFAALVKGLMAPISSANVNIVNAEIIAKERGIVVNEQHSRDEPTHTYSSFVTLRAKPSAISRPTSSRRPGAPPRLPSSRNVKPHQEQVISGYASAEQIFISRLDRFATAFVPEGNLLICHNYDSPGKIGVVGGILGKEGVNINMMTVAPLQPELLDDMDDGTKAGSEALMILGVDREVPDELMKKLKSEEGIIDIRSISL
jgi:D-3-phosphoglycerate dehydrogenase / 2-oxoglutarate reductase